MRHNLKQLGLGVQNYASAWEVLPPTSGQLAGGNDFSMKARLDSVHGGDCLVQLLNQSMLSTDPQNWTCQCYLVYWFLCPSDANVPCGIEPHPSVAGQPAPARVLELSQ